MNKFLIFEIIISLLLPTGFFQAQIENYYLNNKTPEYHEIIKYYDSISRVTPFFKLFSCGKTDSGNPLHLLVISKSNQFDPKKLHDAGKAIIMINNGIHPGEPDGIDACINIVKSFAINPKSIPDDVVICIIPVLNVDGCLKRNSLMRMNQNGPDEFGFRGNAKNLDLNRDFVKCDAENTRSLIKIFHQWKPEIFIDTHVSNGADYPYTMTLISPNSGKYFKKSDKHELPDILSEELKSLMKKKGNEICPYVESVAYTPDSGLYEFNQTPRYLTGLTSLFNCISYVTESHMLKPYQQRVNATMDILYYFILLSEKHHKELIDWKKNKDLETENSNKIYFNWKNDKNSSSTFNFKGYKASYKTSSISGLPHLYYDKTITWEKEIPYYDTFTPEDTARVPEFYVIPQGWREIIEILTLHEINFIKLQKDTIIELQVEYITDFKTTQMPYEGHYLHSDIQTKKIKENIKLFNGDYLIPGHQKGTKFLVESLEAKSRDGFFAWNYFDAVLQQKEWFSDYAFEEVAKKIIEEDLILKTKLEEAKEKDVNLKKNHWQQLNFIFQNSKFKEKTHNQYPIFKFYK